VFQNPVGFEQAIGKTGQKPGFSVKSKEAVPKTEVLERPQVKRQNVPPDSCQIRAKGCNIYNINVRGDFKTSNFEITTLKKAVL
jgi:hypothetical protein